SRQPALAEYNNRLYLVYRARDSDDMWWNVFDVALRPDHGWDDNDARPDMKTSRGPALAACGPTNKQKLYLAYRAADSNELLYSVYDDAAPAGQEWLKLNESVKDAQTSQGPALAAYDQKLYLAYRAADSEDIWFNVYDPLTDSWQGNNRITQNNHTRTS